MVRYNFQEIIDKLKPLLHGKLVIDINTALFKDASGHTEFLNGLKPTLELVQREHGHSIERFVNGFNHYLDGLKKKRYSWNSLPAEDLIECGIRAASFSAAYLFWKNKLHHPKKS